MQLSPPILSHFWEKKYSIFLPKYLDLPVQTKYFIKNSLFVSWAYPNGKPLLHLKWLVLIIEGDTRRQEVKGMKSYLQCVVGAGAKIKQYLEDFLWCFQDF